MCTDQAQKKKTHIMSILKVPVKQQRDLKIEFKRLLLVFKFLRELALEYMSLDYFRVCAYVPFRLFNSSTLVC